jgi:hypothetical protein
MPSAGTPFAIVHIPVLEGREEAIYVARRSAREWFVGGPGFTNDEDSEFQRVDLTRLSEIVDAEAHALDLAVGEHAFQYGAAGQPWERGRIPAGKTFLVTYDVRPTGPSVGPPGVGGAYANCWVVCSSMSVAKRRATLHLETEGWAIVDTIAANEKVADELAEGTETYFRQAQIDGFVCVLHTYPADDVEVS